MSIFEFNEEEEWKKIKDAEREYGREKGRKEGRKEGYKNIISNMLNLGIASGEIAKLVNIPLEDVEKYIQECTDK